MIFLPGKFKGVGRCLRRDAQQKLREIRLGLLIALLLQFAANLVCQLVNLPSANRYLTDIDPTVDSATDRVFDVKIQEIVELDDFDIYNEAGGRNIGITRTFQLAISLDGVLEIEFIGANALISGMGAPGRSSGDAWHVMVPCWSCARLVPA